MKTNTFRSGIIIFLLAFNISCSDWLDIAPKGENVDQTVVMNTESAFRNAVNGIYTELRDKSLYGSNMNLGAIEFMGQSFVTNGSFEAGVFAEFDYASPYAKKVTREIWAGMYKTIYNTNNLLQLFEDKKDVKFVTGSKECMTGELHGLRAMMHFDLLRLFHPSYAANQSYKGIAYMDRTNAHPIPMTTGEIMEKIITDLDKAEELLAGNDPYQTGTNIDTESTLFGMDVKSRPWKLNYYALLALKARVYMYKGDLTNAARYAEQILEDVQTPSKPVASVWNTPDAKDKAFSTEHLFGLASSQNYGIREQSEVVFTQNAIPANQRIMNWFQLGENITDIRKSSWFTGSNMKVKFGTNSWVCDGNVAIVSQRIPMFKISEIYLIASEALANTNFPQAKSYLAYYKLKRTGQDIANTITTPQVMLKMIDNEYKIDFLGEGQLFFYFKRKNEPVIDSYIYESTVNMDDSKYTFPIPQGGMNE